MNRQQIIAKVNEVVAQANKMYKVQTEIASVEFFSKGVAAGRAYPYAKKLEFNEVLARENPTTFQQTVIHEVAHMVTRENYPYAKQDHGPEFRKVIASLGGDTATYHNYDVSSVQITRRKTRYEVKCDCQSHWVTKKTASNAKFGFVVIRCKRCGNACKPTGKTKVVK